jgi:hypothetical protein
LYFLTDDESNFFLAICELIVPEGSDPKTDPGAATVGALSYIDSSLFGMPKESQNYFRGAIQYVNQESSKRFSRKFSGISSDEKNSLIHDLFTNSMSRERMFDLRSLVLEGFYSDYHDPSYQGPTSWDVIGFGGKRISNLSKDWTFLQVWKDSEANHGKKKEGKDRSIDK